MTDPISSSTHFYFYSPRHHRHLHSFPTRRSSDLAGDGEPQDEVQSDEHPGPPEIRCSQGGSPSPVVVGYVGPTHAVDAVRSEEHTSELQSRSDLVCRLLLEKKKSRYNLHDRTRTI